MENHNDIVNYNREAWNRQVAAGNCWTVPVNSQQIAAAKNGDWTVVLTPSRAVPANWFPQGRVAGMKILCLAGAGGQQGPIFAAAGADVTVYDNSESQLAQDEAVAQRDNLSITTQLGDMSDLSCFTDASFDLVFHPCSNCFVEDIRPVWREAHRVLRDGGRLLSGFTNPIRYLFDDDGLQTGNLQVAYKIPYSDLSSISPELRKRYDAEHEPRCFGHTLNDQIAGQLEAGFAITHFYEDAYGTDDLLSRYINTFIATVAEKH